MTYKFNKYIFLFQYDSKNVICYNSLNGALVLLSKKDIDTQLQQLPKDDVKTLGELDFFKSNHDCFQSIKTEYIENVSDELDIIIEFTQQCNLRCPYCYQGTWGRKNTITTEILDCLFQYIKNCCSVNKYKTLRLSLFGGEPLLQKDCLFYAYDHIKQFCKDNDIKLRTFLTTNGLLIDSQTLSHFEEINVSITLSNKSDHDKKRNLFPKSSYDIVIHNLKNVIHLFDFNHRKLSLRFNTDHENIDFFEEFVKTVAILNKNIIVDVAYLEEFETSDGYVNLLSLNDFKKWNSTTAIDILIKYGLCVDAAPKIIRSPCHGYSGFNIKLFANGKIGTCDAFSPFKADLTIQEIRDNINQVRELGGRNNLESLMQNCFCCKDFCLCGGKLFCKKKPCDYGLISLSDFLGTYVKYAELGKADLFSFTKTTKGAINESD